MLGNAAMLLWYDIVPEYVPEHDEWHTREHFPERVGIPGFLRAQRWVAQDSTAPRYFVAYEVSDAGVLTSTSYAERLDNPSDWTRRMMPNFRGMVRGFCTTELRVGDVLGSELLSVRYKVDPSRRAALMQWLTDACLPAASRQRGFASALVLRSFLQPPMTAEQSIRGRDASVEEVVLVTSYAPTLVNALRDREMSDSSLQSRGATDIALGRYQLSCLANAGAAP